MRFLITGGAGFLGSAICRQLIKMKAEVIVFDSFVQYISPLESKYQKYLELRFEGITDKLKIVRGDTRDKLNLQRTLCKFKPQVVIHLAALPLADLSDQYPTETYSTIIDGTVNILENMRDMSFIKRLVFASSSMVYGNFRYEPADEGHQKSPKDIYGGAKYASEVIIEAYGRRYGLDCVIIRPSAIYGPTDINRRVSQIFIERAMANKEIIIYGNGEEKLDFTFVKDTASGFILASLRLEARNEVFNITRGEGRSLNEYAEILKKYFPKLKTTHKPVNLHRPHRGALEISKARKILGYEPEYSLEKGIDEYVRFLKKVN